MKPRLFFYALALAFGIWLAVTVASNAADEPSPTTTVEPTPDPAPPVERTLQGKTIAQWHRVAARYLSRVRSLRRAIRFDPETSTAIAVGCITYRVSCATLWRKAQCESGGWRWARNPSSDASGLFQFLGSTWRSTPYGRLSVFDPYANALAAGWMHANGRGGEWVCR